MSTFRPRKRELALRIESFGDELLVYDLDRHHAHSLNGVAACVWRHADGRTSIADLARLVADTVGEGHDETAVWQALRELDAAALLATPLPSAEPADRSRRAVMARLGWVATVPLITSIVAPTPAHAQSAPNGLTGPTGAAGT